MAYNEIECSILRTTVTATYFLISILALNDNVMAN